MHIKYCGALVAVIVLSACNNDSKPDVIVNSSPVVSNAVVTTQTEVVINDMLTASDVDDDLLSYSLISLPTLGMVVINTDGSYTYTPNNEVTGTDSFTFGVKDSVNAQVNGTVNITIEALEVDFAQFALDAFNQESNAKPLSVNGRVFTNTGEENNFDSLLPQ